MCLFLRWEMWLMGLLFIGCGLFRGILPPRIPVAPEWQTFYSLGAKRLDLDSNVLFYIRGTCSNVAHKIGANIALLWDRLLSCSLEIREHLTGSSYGGSHLGLLFTCSLEIPGRLSGTCPSVGTMSIYTYIAHLGMGSFIGHPASQILRGACMSSLN